MTRASSVCLAIAMVSAGACRGVWDLGDAPNQLVGEGGGTGTTVSSSGGTSSIEASSASVGGGTTTSSSGGLTSSSGAGGSSPSGPCGSCDDDLDCGDVAGEGHCTDGHCERAVWQLSVTAKGVADRFVVTEDFVAMALDEGVEDREKAPNLDNAIVFVDRRTGAVDAHSFAATTLGALAASADGVLAYAPRVPSDELLLVIERDGSVAAWPGAPPDAPLRGLRWDADAAGGGAFRALQSGQVGDRFIRFPPGTFDPCAESADVLAPGRLWATSTPSSRAFISDANAIEHAISMLELQPEACEEAELTTAKLAASTPARPIALASGPGFVATILAPTGTASELELIVATPDGEIMLSEPTVGRAMATGPGGVYAVRDGRLSVFVGTAPTASTPVTTFDPDEPLVDLVVTSEAIFAVTLDSNEEARLVCGVLP